MTTTNDVTCITETLVLLMNRRDADAIKPRQFDMVARELMRTIIYIQQQPAPTPAPALTPVRPPEPDPVPDVRYPGVTVKLLGTSSEALAITGEVRRALKRHGVSSDETTKFLTEALSGDYNHLLQTCMKWVNVE